MHGILLDAKQFLAFFFFLIHAVILSVNASVHKWCMMICVDVYISFHSFNSVANCQ